LLNKRVAAIMLRVIAAFYLVVYLMVSLALVSSVPSWSEHMLDVELFGTMAVFWIMVFSIVFFMNVILLFWISGRYLRDGVVMGFALRLEIFYSMLEIIAKIVSLVDVPPYILEHLYLGYWMLLLLSAFFVFLAIIKIWMCRALLYGPEPAEG